jgi:hypothetical protein
MMREFKFEEDMRKSLACVPMAVRRKLDRVGVKVGLKQWQALGRGERLAICHLPVDSAEECDAVRIFIAESVRNRCASEIKSLPAEVRHAADPPAELPLILQFKLSMSDSASIAPPFRPAELLKNVSWSISRKARGPMVSSQMPWRCKSAR